MFGVGQGRVAGPTPQDLSLVEISTTTLSDLELDMFAIPMRIATDPARCSLEPANRRRTQRLERMDRALRDLLYCAPTAGVLGPDPLVRQLLSAHGFQDIDVLAQRAVVRGQRVTIVVPATNLWHDTHSRSQLLAVKEQAAKEGRTRVLLIPRGSLCNGTRAKVVAKIGKSRGVRYDKRHVDMLVDHVSTARISTIAACTEVVAEHNDPLGVVLSLVARGVLDIARDRPLTGDSWVTTTL